NAAHHMPGHGRIDLTGQLNEARVDAEMPRCPRQIERVNRNAVATQSWSRIERLKTKRLGLGRRNDFPNVDIHGIKYDLELVNQGNMNSRIGILKYFASLRPLIVADGDHENNRPLVKCNRQLATIAVHAANDFGDIARGVLGIARVFPFWTKS